MGYYSPSFANLDSGWYLTTDDPRYAEERDRCLEWWNKKCREVVKSYLDCHGMFVTAFEADIKSGIRGVLEARTSFPTYFAYFLRSQILADPELDSLYRSDYAERAHQELRCRVCGACQTYDDIHPSLIRRTRKVLPLCNTCWFWLGQMIPLRTLAVVSPDLAELVRRLFQERSCRICGRSFQWVDKSVRYTLEVPFLPSRHIEICPRCVHKAMFGRGKRLSERGQLARFRRIAEILGAIPNRSGFVYHQAQSLEAAVEVTKLMQELPTFGELADRRGSWLKLLVTAGVLPAGARQTTFGTRVIARDGHECLSLAEKSIDDLLYEHDIPHEKEPPYPDSQFRADWSLSVGSRTIFVEFFGLKGKPDYERRMARKMAFAKRKGLHVVAFVPEDLEDLRGAFQCKIFPLYEGCAESHTGS